LYVYKTNVPEYEVIETHRPVQEGSMLNISKRDATGFPYTVPFLVVKTHQGELEMEVCDPIYGYVVNSLSTPKNG
jgi:hypothetical protein